MAPRHRSRKHRDLPDNLEPDTKQVDGQLTVYYRYRFPDGRRKSLGKDKAHAIAVAKAMNERLSCPTVQQAASALIGESAENPALSSVIEQFRQHYLVGKRYSKRTLSEIDFKLANYADQWGDQRIRSFTTLQLAQFLNDRPVSAYVKHRKLLMDLFGFAGHQGFIDSNPAAMTLAKSDADRQKKRQRHTMEGYQAIREAAPDWLRRAMDIALRSLQRRGDLTRLHRDQVDMIAGTIRVLQEKTRQYSKPVYLEIQMGPELRGAIQACLATGIPCPYLIHYRPTRMASRERMSKLHPFSVTDDHLTKTFARVRDEVGVYAHLEPGERPTFHDIRALGIWMYQKAGFPPEYINALSGHASDKMREHYAEGHEEVAPKVVRADLSFPENTPKIPRK